MTDFDGDGRRDVASGGDGIVVRYAGAGGGSAVAGDATTTLLAGDINGDGRDDLIAAASQGPTYAYIADPAGSLHLAAILGGFRPGGALGDFNGDGRDDLLRFGAAPRLALGADTAPLSVEIDPGLHAETTGLADSQAVAAADFNRDGRMDAVALSNPDWKLFFIDGAAHDRAALVAFGPIPTVVAADIDGDELPDVLTFLSHALVVYRGNGDGTFRDPQPLAFTDPRASTPWVTAADFSADGRLDVLLTQRGTERARLLVQQDDGSFAETQSLFGEGGESSTTGDFDGDGRPDAAFEAGYHGTIYAHLSRCHDEIRVAPPRVRLTAAGRTLTATLPPGATGFVTFLGQGPNDHAPVIMSEVPVVQGAATLVATLPEGRYTFFAIYWGEGRYGRADAPPLAHTIAGRRRRARH